MNRNVEAFCSHHVSRSTVYWIQQFFSSREYERWCSCLFKFLSISSSSSILKRKQEHVVIWGSLSLTYSINSLAPGKFVSNFKIFTFKLIIENHSLATHCEIDLRAISQELINGKSTLVQVMALCRQAPSHYLSQCWLRSMSLYHVTRPQWINPSGAPIANMV